MAEYQKVDPSDSWSQDLEAGDLKQAGANVKELKEGGFDAEEYSPPHKRPLIASYPRPLAVYSKPCRINSLSC